MNIQWVLADDLILDPTVDIKQLKQAGALWGSWKTWRAYNTDNVICHNSAKAEELIKKAFQATCNFYIPNSVYKNLNQPLGVRLYEGNFMGHDADKQDELVAMFLAGSICEVVLLVGFDWNSDQDNIKARNHNGLFLQAIKSKPDVQWILVDYPGELPKELAELPNLDTDSFENVLSILNG